MDWGGLQREFFTVLGRELFDAKTKYGGGLLFTKMGSGNFRVKFFFFGKFLVGSRSIRECVSVGHNVFAAKSKCGGVCECMCVCVCVGILCTEMGC